MNKQGYTLMEVSLFLAISGLLTLVAIVGIGPRLTNVRFSTGMRDIQNNITKELSATARGQGSNTKSLTCNSNPLPNPLPSPTNNGGTNSTCVLSGKIAIFEASQVTYRDIVASATLISSTGCTNSSEGTLGHILSCFKPHIVPQRVQSSSSFALPNGIKRTYPISAQPQAYGFIKSPENNTTFRFYITGGVNWDLSMDNGFITYDTTSDSFPVCYKLANRTAKITFYRNSDDSKLEINGTCP